MAIATVQRFGEALVVVLPLELQQELNLAEGAALEMEAQQGKLLVRRRKYTLQELLDQCDPDIPFSDEDRAWDAMRPVGREIL